MTLDINSLAPLARERYLAIGRRYSSEDVLAQAHKTLLAHQKYGHLLVAYGFGLGDAGRLAEGRDLLHARKLGRSQVSSDRKILRNAHKAVRRRALDERSVIASALELVLDTLYEASQHEVAGRVLVAVDEAKVARPKDQKLLEQLDTLEEILEEPAVAQAMADRGGVAILVRLQEVRAELNDGMRLRAANHEASAIADERDILDGIIVSLARAARKASRVAARHLGQPAIASAFKLTYLRSRTNDTPESGDPEAPSDLPADPVTDAPDNV